MSSATLKAPTGSPAPEQPEPRQKWYRVMCLTGVDYFSSLGYAPGIAALAAGLVSPLATIGLVILTLGGALPVYRRVALESPHGQGSIAMLERLLGFWKGKLFVLVLLGFACTDFVITMTLSAADGAAHLRENPHVPSSIGDHPMLITFVFLLALGAVFFRGFKEAIGIAVVLVCLYLALNAVVVLVGVAEVFKAPSVFSHWRTGLTQEHGSALAIVGVSLLAFPKLALGMSGFETGVAVMPQIQGDPTDTPARPLGLVRETRKLLASAAIIMSTFLILSSWVCTLLIPQDAFKAGGAANGRALAYLAHEYLGSGFGSIYDISTITILWFAGASAMAGLLNLIPRYLPRYGMSPQWAGATRPLVVVVMGVAFLITWIFDASVDAQGGAYATGVLVLMSSGAVAVTLAARKAGQRKRTVAFAVIALIFCYTTIVNCVERPDGLKIGGCFILAIVVVSLLSRIGRSFELRTTSIELDATADRFLRDCARRRIRLVANEPGALDAQEYDDKTRQVVADHDLTDEGDIVFIEVTLTDPSDFEGRLSVHGVVVHGHRRVLRMESATVPNALAALLMHIRDVTGVTPHIYFEWTEGGPVINLLRFLFLGIGEVAPTTREVLRRAEPDRSRRPHVHVG
ncbi:amino acid transporter [Nocardioides sp. BP30]|uniref:amino acid transporter n=1 Tax=Nocardioides sp. BP30 TaxID=3036374 RepID=UPI0024683B08|nr:amino acid transporter [Nocardioides sp. BP30]WGL51559.1 amino acid transporter [Nocardioides sp. BP30]